MPLLHFFSAPIGAYGNALVNWTGRPISELVSYAASYRHAAMNLVSFHEQRGFGSIDHAALPILFLYRHSLELYLKAIVYRAAVLTIKEHELAAAIPRLWREHSLVALFEMAKPVLSESPQRHLTLAGALLQKVGGLAAEIEVVDSGSYTFRYPVNSQGQLALKDTFLTNIFRFSEHVESVLDDVAQFCRSLEHEQEHNSEQMKLALHRLRG